MTPDASHSPRSDSPRSDSSLNDGTSHQDLDKAYLHDPGCFGHDIDPADYPATPLGQCARLYDQGDWDGAKSLAEEQLMGELDQGDQIDLLELHADCCAFENDTEGAIASLREAIDIAESRAVESDDQDTVAELYFSLALRLAESDNWDGVSGALSSGESWGTAQAREKNIDILETIGEVLVDQGNYQKASDYYRYAYRKARFDRLLSGKSRAESLLLTVAETEVLAGEFDAAKRSLQPVLGTEPPDDASDFWTNRGRALLILGTIERNQHELIEIQAVGVRIDDFVRASGHRVSAGMRACLYQELANIALYEDRVKVALHFFERAANSCLDETCQNYDAAFEHREERFQIQLGIGDTESAEQELDLMRELQELHLTSREDLYLLTYELEIELCLTKCQPALARDVAERAITIAEHTSGLEPVDLARCLYKSAKVCLELGENEAREEAQALEAIERALGLELNMDRESDLLLRCDLLQLKAEILEDPEEALECLDTALDLTVRYKLDLFSDKALSLRMEYAQALLEVGENKQAFKEIDSMIERYRQEGEDSRNLAELYYARADLQRELDPVEEALVLKDFEEGLRVLSRINQEYSGFAGEILLERGQYLADRYAIVPDDDYRRLALDNFRRAEEIFSASPNEDRSNLKRIRQLRSALDTSSEWGSSGE